MSSARPSRTTRSSASQPPPQPPLPPAHAASRARKPSFTVTVDPPTTAGKLRPSAAPSKPTASSGALKAVRNAPARAAGDEGTPRSRPGSAAGNHPMRAAHPARVATPSGRATPGQAQHVHASELAERGRNLNGAATGSVDDLKGKVEPGQRAVDGYDPAREPIQAYLRIRPAPANATSASTYLEVRNSSEVVMVPPAEHRLNPSTSTFFGGSLLRSGPLAPVLEDHASLAPPSPVPFGTLYKFTKVFSPSTPLENSQAAFFRETTLPMVHDFLKGQNCLLFAYGPSGSGKTWTVQGGEGDNAGLLPRVMDVVWRSLNGKESKTNLRTTRLAGVGIESSGPITSTPTRGTSFSAPGLGIRPSFPVLELPDIVPVDDGFDYSIWVSYAEIYNEKIYDLLEAPLPTPSASTSSTHHGMFQTGLGLLSVGGAKAKAMVRGFSTVKRNALSLKPDKAAGSKYVHGMKEIRVHSAEEARAILDRGQQNRRVYSTLANRVSSRSHSIFTIKVVKAVKGGDPEDPAQSVTSKFSIVDLAGSERVVNTQTSGDRLKEAGMINKSLMVLGQCMEVLRKNQEVDKGRKLAIVPFRHSKLTELFQSFFVGDGKAAMIVNVNPYDTGFDENSHVMKFSAVAKGVLTAKDAPPQPIMSAPPQKEPRVVRLSMVEGADEEDVVYEEEDDGDDDDEPDEFVNALLEELSKTRTLLFEAQLNATLAASQARTQTAREYEAKLLEMEARHHDRLREEALAAEDKFNAKLEILKNLQQEMLSPGLSYDDSDDDQTDETIDEEEVESMLLGDTSVLDNSPSSAEPSPSAFASLRIHPRLVRDDNLMGLPLGTLHSTRHSAGVCGNESLESSGHETEVPSLRSSFEEDPDKFEDSMAVQAAASSATRYSRPKSLLEPASTSPPQLMSNATKKRGALSKSTAENHDDPDALNRSVIVPVGGGGVKKPKRKLGGLKVTDADALDQINDIYSIPESASGRSMLSKSGSTRSLLR